MSFREQIRSAYDKGAKEYAKAWPSPHPWLATERAEFVKRVGAGNEAIDLGCGPGHDTAWFSQKGIKCTGLDVAPKMIKAAQSRYPTCSFLVLDFFEIAKLSRKFKGIWAAYSLLHVPPTHLVALLGKLRDVTERDGTLFIGTPISEQTKSFSASIAGLSSEDGSPISVDSTHWKLDVLKEHISAHFKIDLLQESKPLPGRGGVVSIFATAKGGPREELSPRKKTGELR